MKESDAPQRWQKIAIEQRGFLVNVLLTLATASLGFVANQLSQGVQHSNGFSDVGALEFSGVMFASSIAFGLIGSVIRLRDFRLTSKIVRTGRRLRNHGLTEARVKNKLAKSRLKCKRLGLQTNASINAQLLCFGVGIIASGFAVWLKLGSN